VTQRLAAEGSAVSRWLTVMLTEIIPSDAAFWKSDRGFPVTQRLAAEELGG